MPLLEQQRRAPRDDAPRRPRPGLTALTTTARRWWPPVWAAAFLFAAGAGARCAGPGVPHWEWAARLAAVLPLLLAVGGPRFQATVWAAMAAAAFLWGQGEAADRRSRPASIAPAPVAPAVAASWQGPVLFRATGFPSATRSGGWRTPAVLIAVGPGDEARPPRRGEGVWLTGDGPPPAPGTLMKGAARFAPPAPSDIRGSFDLQQFLAGRALAWRGALQGDGFPLGGGGPASRLGRAGAGARRALLTAVDELLPAREAALGAAVLLGVRTARSREDTADFSDLGLAHLFAVSGLHVGILAGLLLLPLAAAGAGPGARACVAAAALPAYAVLTGAPGSVIRAGALVVTAAAAAAAGRRSAGLRLLGVVFWAVTFWEPRSTLDGGLRLSYAAAAGIIGASALTGGFRLPGPRLLRAAAAGLGVSLAAQWATLPVAAAAFGSLNPWSPLVNMLVVPVFGVAVWLLAAAVVLTPVWSYAAESLAAWSWLLLRALSAGAALAAGAVGGAAIGLPPPGVVAVAVWGVASAALVAVLRRRIPWMWRAAGALLLLAGGVMVFGPAFRSLPPRNAPEVVQFAVGQGDCGLVAFPDGWTALIDAADAAPGRDGVFAREVAPWLARQGCRKLDAVILTHGHRDHTGGAEAVMAAVAVGLWVGGGRAALAVTDARTPWLRPGPAVRTLHRWRDWSLDLLDPTASGPLHDENDRSLVVVLRQGEAARMVWTGDLERGGEAVLLRAGLVPAGTDVWKAGHHGSDTSGSGAFLAALRPRTVLISCGVGNRYRHPSHGPYVLGGDTLEVVRTDLQGTVRVSWKGGSARVAPLRRGPP